MATEREKPLTLEQVKQQYIKQVLQQTDGNKTEAAKILGVDRRTLIRHDHKRTRRSS